MKKLKILFLLILTSLTLGVGMNGVKAFTAGERYLCSLNDYDYTTYGDIARNFQMRAGTQPYSVWNYYGKPESNGKEVKLYCVDPTKPNNVGGYVKIKEVYNFNDTTIDLKTRSLYYGLYTILSNGGRTKNDNRDKIVITDMAARTYYNTIMVGLSGWSNTNDPKIIAAKNAIINLGCTVIKEMAEDSSVKQKLEKLGIVIKKSCENGTSFGTLDSKYNYIISDANRLIKTGVRAAIEFYDKKGIENETSVSRTVENGQTTDRFSEEKIITFKITKGEDGYVKIGRSADIVCQNCEQNGVTIGNVEYWQNNEWKPLPSSRTDISEFVDSNNKVKLKITLNKTMTESENCNAKVTVYYVIPQTEDVSVALFVGDGTQNSTQRYLGVVPNYVGGSDADDYIRPSFDISGISCIGINCDSTLTTPECSKDADGKASITAPEDIKRCIIDKNDDAGNPYKLDDNYGGVNNAYCGTFCKEDYQAIQLNRAIDKLNCGGYFKLKATIVGTMDCYRGSGNTTDKSIDRTKFNNDMIEIQKEFIKAYNDFQEAQTARPCVEWSDEGECTKWEYVTSGSYTGLEANATNIDTGYVSTRSMSTPTNFEFTASNDNEDVNDIIDEFYDNAYKAFNSLKTKYNNIIASYNNCTTQWDNTFKFDPKIYWEYDQTYYSLLSDDEKYLVPATDDVTISQEIKACAGNVGAQFGDNDCSTGWANVDTMFENLSFTVCTTEGCGAKSVQVSKAKYVKQHFAVDQEYVTPTVFYQVNSSGSSSGGITTNKYLGPNVQLSPVGKDGGGLPLALDAEGGGVFKMHIENLGEFYDSGELGRLVDFEGDHENNSVAKAIGYENTWNGNYICNYYTTCLNKNCPECDFVCEGEFCEWQSCPDCTNECINCIYNLGKLQFTVKPVSPTKFNSIDREYGYNWNINSTLNALTLIRAKAEDTIKKMEEANTTIYEESDENSHLELSVRLDPNTTNYILEYNKDVENNNEGGYNNITTECYDYEDSEHKVYENLFCYSTFIDDLIDNTDSVLYVKASRLPAGSRTDESVQNSTYWEPWTEYKFNENVIGGPAHK